MDWINTIISLAGGGLIVKAIEIYIKSGETTLTDCMGIIKANTVAEVNYIENISVEMQFINTASTSTIIKNIKAKYCDGLKAYDATIEGYNIKPADVIPEKGVKILTFKLEFPYYNIQCPLPIEDDSFLEIAYTKGSKNKTVTIKGNELRVKDDSLVYAGGSY